MMKNLFEQIDNFTDGEFDIWRDDAFGIDAFGVDGRGNPDDFLDMDVEIVKTTEECFNVRNVQNGIHCLLMRKSVIIERTNKNISSIIIPRWLATSKGLI